MKKLIMLSILCALTLSTYSQNIFNIKPKQEKCISGDCVNWYVNYTWANGGKYIGQWKDDLIHGKGTATFVDGTIEEGLWENDEFLGNE